MFEKSDINKLTEITKTAFQSTATEPVVDTSHVPAYHYGSKFDRVPYWQNIERWKGISEKQFLSYKWGVS